MTYRVNDVYRCIQGEGTLAGTPMLLVRLQGCGVGCPWCDTKETWVSYGPNKKATLHEALGTSALWAEVTGEELADYVKGIAQGQSWVLLTGGEPAEQDLGPLVKSFHDRGLKVAIETSGTATGHLHSPIDHVTVSPKIGMPGGKVVDPGVVYRANDVKFVIAKESDLEEIDALLADPEIAKRLACLSISVQPVSLSKKATALCVRLAHERGWRVSLQLHKYLGER